jgi:hypothetical protein
MRGAMSVERPDELGHRFPSHRSESGQSLDFASIGARVKSDFVHAPPCKSWHISDDLQNIMALINLCFRTLNTLVFLRNLGDRFAEPEGSHEVK